MATSGKITGTAKKGSSATSDYDFWCDWKRNSYSIDDDTSNITVYLRVKCTEYANSAWSLLNKPAVSLSVGGSAKTPNSIDYIDTRNYATATFATWTGNVKHNADGTPNCPIVASFTLTGPASLTGGSLSGSANLDTIPQATSLDSLSCSTSYFTGTMTYKYTPKASTLYNRCNISLHLGDEYISVKRVDLGKKAASQQTATVMLSADELAIVYNKLPSVTKGTLRFTFRTYSDADYSNQVGDASVKELTLNIPNNSSTQPTVGMVLEPVGSLPDAFDGLYIKGKTKVHAKTLDAAPKYNAKITSYSLKVDGVSYGSSANYTSAILSKYGTVVVTGYATDSRGFTGSMEKSITVIDYAKPKILNVEAFRCDANGNAADTGTYLKIKATRSYSKVVANEVQKNFCLIRYRWKPVNGSYSSWTTILAKTASGDTVTTGALLGGALDAKTTYVVQVQAYDDIGEHAETEVSIPTETVYMHRTKNAMGLGKYAEGDELLDVAWDAHFHGDVKIGDMTLREYILSIIEGG